jgi:hypothetical protein
LGKKLASPHPPTPDELKKPELIWPSTTDAGILTWSSEAREKQESGEKTVYVYIGSASHHPGGLDWRRRYIRYIGLATDNPLEIAINKSS